MGTGNGRSRPWLGWLGLDRILLDLGFNGMQRAAVAGSLIGRMAAPGSELATWQRVGLKVVRQIETNDLAAVDGRKISGSSPWGRIGGAYEACQDH